MTLSLRSLLLSLSALLAAGPLCACDTDDQLEALGVEIADLDAMSEEELDELACVDELELAADDELLPPIPRPSAPELHLVDADAHNPFFAHTDELLASDRLGVSPEDEGCDSNGDDADLAAG